MIVYYADGDHSAVCVSTSEYVSKWSDGPLMQHEPSYCPYISTGRQYFKVRLTSQKVITGNNPVALNQANDYTISGPATGFEYEANVFFMEVPSPESYEFYELSSTKYRLICKDYGYFKIEYFGYYNDYYFDGTSFTVICMPM